MPVLLAGKVPPDLWKLAVFDRFRGQLRDFSHVVWEVFPCQKAGRGGSAGGKLSGALPHHRGGLPDPVGGINQKVTLGMVQKVADQKEGRIQSQSFNTGISKVDSVEDRLYQGPVLNRQRNRHDLLLVENLRMIDLCGCCAGCEIVCRGQQYHVDGVRIIVIR